MEKYLGICYWDGEVLSSFLSEREQLSESLRTHDQLKRASSKLWWGTLSPFPSLGMTSPPNLLFSLGREVLEGCHEVLLPLIDCFLQRKEVWDMEKPAGWLADDYVLWEKQGTANPVIGQLEVFCWSEPLKGLFRGLAGRKWGDWAGWDEPAILAISMTSKNSA